jgi:hypothetical protein
VVIALLVWSTAFASQGSTEIENDFAPRVAVLRNVLLGFSLPAMFCFFVIRAVAVDDSHWQECAKCQLKLLRSLRRELLGLLRALGILLTLIVIATGLRRRTFLALSPEADIPQESVLLYGAVFLVLLGLLHLIANSALDTRSQAMLEIYAPLPSPDGAEFTDQLQRHHALAELTGVSKGWQSFESSAIIGAPLLTALLAIATGS